MRSQRQRIVAGRLCNLVGIAYFDPAGSGPFSTSTITPNIAGWRLATTHWISALTTLTLMEPDWPGLCTNWKRRYRRQPVLGGLEGTSTSSARKGNFVYIATVDSTGSSLPNGTYKKKFLLQVIELSPKISVGSWK
jgi:hypothetical protein